MINKENYVPYMVKKYGVKQIEKTMEELMELYDNCHKYMKKKLVSKSEFITEIADVEIMMEQLKYLFSISEDEVEKEKDYKINRQISREME